MAVRSLVLVKGHSIRRHSQVIATVSVKLSAFLQSMDLYQPHTEWSLVLCIGATFDVWSETIWIVFINTRWRGV